MPPQKLATTSRPPHPRSAANRIAIGSFPVVRKRIDPLLRRLALDRIRDLRDDGVTLDYIGRMYEVSGDRIRQLEDDLRR